MSVDDNPRLIAGERTVFTTNKHWAGLIVRSLWPIALVLASFLVAWVQPESTTGVVGFVNRILELVRLALFLGGCGWIVYNVIAWRTAEYSVTNLRIFGHEGLVRRRSTDTLLSSVADIRTVVPALGGMLGFGNIRIVTAAGDAGRDAFTAVRDPMTFKRHVLEQKTAGSASAARTPATPAGESMASASTSSLASSLELTQLLGQLASLRDSGAITDDEFEAKKADVLRRI